MQKFEEILTSEDLIDYFEGKTFDKIDIENKDAEDKNFPKYLESLIELKTVINKHLKTIDKKTINKSDAFFSNIIYGYLESLPRRELTDIRFWQMLSLEYLQNYIWYRWYKSDDPTKNIPLRNEDKIKILKSKDKSSLFIRFLGGSSLKSLTSRQAISRLFWPRHILKDSKLVELCFEKQDIAVAVFERQYGMHPEAAKAFIKNISIKHSALEKKNIQLEAKILNRYFATINPDYLDQNSIKKLLFI